MVCITPNAIATVIRGAQNSDYKENVYFQSTHNKLLTFFSTCRVFEDQVQRIAVRSWLNSKQVHKVILMVENLSEFQAVNLSEFGDALHLVEIPKPLSFTKSPRLDLLFQLGEALASTRFVCYINSDIVLGSSFVEKSLETLTSVRVNNENAGDYVIFGSRLDCKLHGNLSTLQLNKINSFEMLERFTLAPCLPHGFGGKDYFLYPRGMFERKKLVLPPFWIGKFIWDHYLVNLTYGFALDATPVAFVGHLTHKYHWYEGGDEVNENTKERKPLTALEMEAEKEIKYNQDVLKQLCGGESYIPKCLPKQSTYHAEYQLCPVYENNNNKQTTIKRWGVVNHSNSTLFNNEYVQKKKLLNPNRRIFQDFALAGISPPYWGRVKIQKQWANALGCA